MSLFTFNPETDEVTFLEYGENDKKDVIPEDQILMESITYFLKTFNYFNVRERLTKAVNYWIQAPEDKVEEYYEQIKIETAGILILQDICENRKLRQGKPTVHNIYGIPHAISVGMFSALASFSLNHYKEELITKPILNYFSVKDFHIELRDRAICPTEQLYYEICGEKGSLIQLSGQILLLQQLFGTNKVDLKKFLDKIKIFLTIVDECRRVAINDTDDIRAGHFSFPIMYAINNNEKDGEFVLDIIRKRTEEEIVLKHALSIVKKSDCFEYAKKQLRLLRSEIIDEYYKLDRNPLMDDFFNDYLNIPENFEDITWEI